MEIDKPHKSFDDQIDYLRNEHHLIIGHDWLSMSLLKSMSYYDLINGYKEVFMRDGVHYEDVSIEDLFQYSFADRTFQSIIFKYSILVETRFRYIFSNVIAEEFGETQLEYLDIKKYKRPSNRDREKKLQEAIRECTEIYKPSDPSHYVEQPTCHYLSKKSHVPPWILFKNASFSTLTSLYSFLPENVKTRVSDELVDFDISPYEKNEFCYNALTIIRQFRNKIAHDLKFISFNSSYKISQSKLKNTSMNLLITPNEIKSGLGRNDHFALLLCITVMLNCIPLQRNMIDDLQYYFNGPQKVSISKYLKDLGIPNDYVERMTKYLIAETSKQSSDH